MTTSTITPTSTISTTDGLEGPGHTQRIAKALRRKTFGTLATVSDAGNPHSAGVVYVWADGAMWVHTMRSSRKARNIAHQPRVGVTVPFRRLPAGPPYTLHFQARAELVAMGDPQVRPLLESRRLKLIAGHGALDEPDGVFVRIVPTGTIHSYGPGARALDLIRDPLHSGAGRASAHDVLGAIR